jgi:uncharacterized protein YjbI with pentapeptide repeats
MDLLEYVKQRLRRPEPPTLEFWWLEPVLIRPPAGSDPRTLRPWLEAQIADAHDNGHNLNLCGSSLEGLDLGSLTDDERPKWNGLVFGVEGKDQPANLSRVRFSKAVLTECRFANVIFDRVDFTECELVDCDLRYAQFRSARLGHATFERCDMFGASIHTGTIATDLHFRWSTLPELGGGITGLEWSSFDNDDLAAALAGENAKMYASLLSRTEQERPEDAKNVADAIDERLLGAAANYRRLSGYFATQGSYNDADTAYRRSKRLDRQSAGPRYAYTRRHRQEGTFLKVPNEHGIQQTIMRQRKRSLLERWKDRFLHPLRWSWLWVADITSRFGQSLWAVTVTILAVTFLPGFAYALWGGVKGAHGLGDNLYYSASHLAAANPAHLEPAGRLVEWLGLVQSTLALTLVALFGFVLGNLLRQS